MTGTAQQKNFSPLALALFVVFALVCLTSIPAYAYVDGLPRYVVYPQSKLKAAMVGMWFFSFFTLIATHALLVWFFIKSSAHGLTKILKSILCLQITFVVFIWAMGSHLYLSIHYLGLEPEVYVLYAVRNYTLILAMICAAFIAVIASLFALHKKISKFDRAAIKLLACMYFLSVVVMYMIAPVMIG